MPSIFLCHSSRDKFFVRKLAERLTAYGVRVWLDEAEIRIGDSFIGKIGRAIAEADFVGVVLSHTSIGSTWVQKELEAAMHKELEQQKVVVLPLLLEPVSLPIFLKDKKYGDFTSQEKFENTFPELLAVLGVQPDDSAEPSPVPTDLELPKVATPSTVRLEGFEDIAVIDLDGNRSYKPDPDKALYNVYFDLSDTPSVEWQGIFEAERIFPRHYMWRDAWIEGNNIVVHCAPDEIEKYHLNDIKQDAHNANAKYRQYLTERAQVEARELQRQREGTDQFTELKRRLDFD